MRSFEELLPIYDCLEQSNRVGIYSNSCQYRMSAMRLKRIWVILEYLYPHTGSVDYIYVDDKWDWYFYGGNLEDGEIISSSSLLYNRVMDRVVQYMMDSPFWEVDMVSCYVDSYGCEEEETRKEVEARLKDFFVDVEIPDALFEEFTENDECEEGMCCVRSLLHPYVAQIIEKAKGEYPLEVEYLEKAFSVVCDWLSGSVYDIRSRENSYFICLDGADPCFSSGYVEFREEMIIAPELIESIIFKLDAVYHILPKGLTEKGGSNSPAKGG